MGWGEKYGANAAVGLTVIVTFVIKRAESSLGGSCRGAGRDPGEFGSR